MREFLKKCVVIFDFVLWIFVIPSALLLKLVRRLGIQRLPFCKKVLLKIGVFPIRNHYYEPQFNFNAGLQSFSTERNLPGINLNTQNQLNFLKELTYAEELKDIPLEQGNELEFSINNNSFLSGDAEYWYQLIRNKKPNTIIEIGSGNSTLMAIKAIAMNKCENPEYSCNHICIEPYEQKWLEKSGVTVIRKKVEELELSFFSMLETNDILFIDSSHIIRPEGDVLFEYLQILPFLKIGVIVHFHDIFSPRNYPRQWIKDEILFWNEQYLLEAFLTHNSSWEVIGALNYLHHNHYNKLKNICPFLEPSREPGSFYIRKES